MQHAIQRETLERHFVPRSAGGAMQQTRADATIQAGRAAAGVPTSAARTGRLRSAAARVGSTIFWAVMGEKALARAISQERMPAALLHGSLAAGTVYMQQRRTTGRRPVSSY